MCIYFLRNCFNTVEKQVLIGVSSVKRGILPHFSFFKGKSCIGPQSRLPKMQTDGIPIEYRVETKYGIIKC